MGWAKRSGILGTMSRPGGDGGSGAAERGWPRGPAGSGSARSRAKGEAGGDGGSRPPDREPLSR